LPEEIQAWMPLQDEINVLMNATIGLNGKFLRFLRDGPFLKR
jgi:hypothetical protein